MNDLLLEVKPATRWRIVAAEHPIAVAVLAGILATHMATIFGYWMHGIGLPAMDWPRFNGYLIMRAAFGADPEAIFGVADFIRLSTGWIAHSFTGAVFAVVFAVGIHPYLPWKDTTVGNMGKALVWAFVLATISALWWVPALFPEFHLGFFSSNVSNTIAPDYASWQAPFAIYVWHLIWGVTLGLIYNPMSADDYRSLKADVAAA